MNVQYAKNDRLGKIVLEYMAQARNIFVDIWEKLFNFFTSYRWQELAFNIKLASVIISLVFAGLIIFLLLRINMRGRIRRAVLSGKNPATKKDNKKIIKKWGKIENKLIFDSEENYKLAILEAGEFFEKVLNILGNAAMIRITNMTEIEEIKKIKNNIIDNSEFKLTKEEAMKIIAIYKKGLTDLGVL